jgi:hypothetical protein
MKYLYNFLFHKNNEPSLLKTPWLLAGKRTIPTERPPLVGENSAKFADIGYGVVSVTDPRGC